MEYEDVIDSKKKHVSTRKTYQLQVRWEMIEIEEESITGWC